MNTLKFFFLTLVIVISPLLAAGDETDGNDTLYVPSVKLGFDVSGFARKLVEPETLTAELSVDYEWQEYIFGVVEAGMLTVDVEKQSHTYQTEGRFIRAGVDFNIFKPPGHSSQEGIFVSGRYGYGTLEQRAPYILIHDPFWGDYETSIESDRYRAHWLEAGIGLKTELWRNLFLGWSLRGRLLLAGTSDPDMEPYFIGGFGKNGGSTSLMLHYSIYYRVPFR
ncbi:MAG: DUF6048 family protein [Bacteroidales bacterium]